MSEPKKRARKAAKKVAKKAPAVAESFDDPELASSGKQGVKAVIPTGGKASGDPGPEREKAFNGGGFEWKGMELHGMTSGRWSTYLEMRAGVTSLELLDSLGGDAWFSDSLRILYFCATTQEDWRPFRRDAMAWQEEIERWADEHVERDDRLALEALTFEIYKESRINRHEPAAEGGSGAGK